MKTSRPIKFIILLGAGVLSIIICMILLSDTIERKYHWWMINFFGKEWGIDHWEKGYYSLSRHTLALALLDAIPYVKEGLKSDKTYLRLASLVILEKMSPPHLKKSTIQDQEIVPLITNILKYDSNDIARKFSISILSRVKGQRVSKDLEVAIRDKSALVRDEAALIYIELGLRVKDVIPQLIEILEVGILVKDLDMNSLLQNETDRRLVRFFEPYQKNVIVYIYLDTHVIPSLNFLMGLTGTQWGYNMNKSRKENEESIRQMRKWWQENKDYLYWSDKENHFVIDEGAKAAGIPTEEYRKTHPWPKEENKNK